MPSFRLFGSPSAANPAMTSHGHNLSAGGQMIGVIGTTGALTARYAYDPFGKRHLSDGNCDAAGTLVVGWSPAVNKGTDRGYTGHEHLGRRGLTHMNGRVFDPTLDVFLQADPVMQAP